MPVNENFFISNDGMTHKNIISPSILSADFANLQAEIQKTANYGAQWCHIDVMDGHFVPNITIGACVVKSLKKVTELKLDVHLMIENPLKYIDDFILAGADIITFHIEAANDAAKKCIEIIKNKGALAGISIKPKTPACVLEQYIPLIDMALIMTVEPGFSGQKFIPGAAEKIWSVKKMAEKNKKDNLIIQVDGGINDKTAKICKEFGANCFVAGNFVYKNPDMKNAVRTLLD